MTSDSCDPNYFTYQHAYRCSDASDLAVCTYDSEGEITNSPCQYNESTCAFQPRVHVRDNWGWCTGGCSLDGAEGCYAGDDYGLSDSNNRNSECAYGYYDDGARISASGVNPWISYDGVIYVEE